MYSLANSYCARHGVARPRLGQTKPVPAPGVCCQLTEDGISVICSDGQGYSVTCPHCPGPNMPGTAKYQQQGTLLVPIPPAPGSCDNAAPGAAGGGGTSMLLPIAGLALAGIVGYFLLR
jgi:hypothetical protein